MQVSIRVTCDCETKFIVYPPEAIQNTQKELRYFDLHCPYCQGFVGNFHFDTTKEE